MNCDELELIEMGRFSFSDYAGKFELKNLPSLSFIKLGEIGRNSYNFYYSSFVMESMGDCSLAIQIFPIWYLFHWVMERSNSPQQLLLIVHRRRECDIDLPNLTSINLGSWSLAGNTLVSSCSLVMKSDVAR